MLGHVEKMDKTLTNFIAMRYGMGMFYVHLEPAVFTNYFLLEGEHHHYGETVLSYIPSHQDVIWSLNNQTSKVISDSPYRFILSQPALAESKPYISLGAYKAGEKIALKKKYLYIN